MIDKKMVISKKNILNIFGILIVVGLLVYVFAATTGLGSIGSSLTAAQNLTAVNTSITINCTASQGDSIYNVTILVNETGGPATQMAPNATGNLSYLRNVSTFYANAGGNQTEWNTTIDISTFNESNAINITCFFTNWTGAPSAVAFSWAVSTNISIDRTAPRVTNLSILIGGSVGNWTSNIKLNTSVNDTTMFSLNSILYSRGQMNVTARPSFNFTNGSNGNASAGDGNTIINKSASVTYEARPLKQGWWNTTFNISTLSEGFHYVCVLANDTNQSGVVANVNNSECIRFLVDVYTPPRVSNFTGFENNSFVNDSWVFNVSAWDANVSGVYFNITNSTSTILYANNFTMATVQRGQSYETYWAATINTSKLGDGTYNVTVYANDSPALSSIPVNVNQTESIQITIDNNAPSVSHTCSPSSTLVGQIVTCTCTGDDGFGGGINHTYDDSTSSSTSSLVTSVTPSTAGTYSRSCTAVDRAGHKTTVSASYTISPSSSTSTGGGSSSTTSSTSTSKASITADSPVTMTGFIAGSGVKEINVEVTESASNVEITVTKYGATAPSTISTPKTGTYKYFQIQTQNLISKLEKAIMTIQVEKTWVASQGLAKENVALFKYDETAKVWNEFTTTFKNEDATYYYYTVDLNSFSYFAIAPKSVVTTGESSTGEQTTGEQTPTGGEQTSGMSNIPSWVWIVAGLMILAAIVFLIIKKKMR